jgi:hypothetical protein
MAMLYSSPDGQQIFFQTVFFIFFIFFSIFLLCSLQMSDI